MMQIGAQPISTYLGWKHLGRQVKAGSHAISLYMPVTIKDREHLDQAGEPTVKQVFVYRANWFGLDQTDGAPYKMPDAIPFDKSTVLTSLGITEVPFAISNGNVQGYAEGMDLAINPVAEDPLSTMFHELGHIVLGHTDKTIDHSPQGVSEVEAEAVAYILCSVFEYTKPMADMRGYIQNWNKANDGISKDSAKRIFKAVSDILKANSDQLEN